MPHSRNYIDKLTIWDKLILIYLLVVILMLIIGYIPYGYPLTHFMTERGRFDDFFNSVDLARRLPIKDDGYQLSPGLIFIFRMIDRKVSFIVFMIYNIATLILIYKAMVRIGVEKLIIFILLISYPILFSIARGNAELLAFALVLTSYSYLANQDCGRAINYLLAAVFVKPTAIVWVFLIPIWAWKRNINSVLFFIAISIIVALSINSNLINLYFDSLSSLNKYKNDYIFGAGGDLFNNSLWGMIKTFIYYINIDGFNQNIEFIPKLFSIVNNISYALLIIVLFYAVFIVKNDLVTLTILLGSIPILLAPVSCDYRLVYLLLPTIILIKNNYVSNELVFIYVIILLLILPKHFIQFNNLIYGNPTTLQSIVNPILLATLLIFIFCSKFDRSKLNIKNILIDKITLKK